MSGTLKATGLSKTAINRQRAERRKQTSQTVKGVRERMNSTTGTRPDFDREMLALFANNHLGSTLAMPTFTLAIAAGIGYVTDPIIAGIWCAMVLIGQAVLILLARRYTRCDLETVSALSWTRHFTLAEALHGLTWAALVVVMLTGTADPSVETLLFSLLLVVIALKSMLSSALPIATLAGTLPISFAMALGFGLQLDALHIAMATITMGAQVFFLFVGQRMHDTALAMLEARAEKDELIAELEQQRAIAEGAARTAEEANLAKSHFLATMSHELRTPLNAILGFSEVMTAEVFGPLPNEQYKEYVRDIHTSGKHLLNLINELLDLSRIEAGRHKLDEEAMTLSYAVEEGIHLLNMKAKNKNITITERFEPHLPRLWADERAVRQIALNLLSNAIKFTPSGGEIIVRVGWTTDGGQYMAFRDTGPGIPEDEIPVVLSNFGQGSLARKSAEQGTGLGLPIVQALMKLHGGSFSLTSKLREGTEVICTFPPERVMDSMPQMKERPQRRVSNDY